MNELGGALRELAREAQAPAPVDPGELWAQGRQRVRRRRVAVGTLAVVAVLLGSLAITRPQPTVVMPAGQPHAPAIPKNIYEPNRFLAGVSKAGPPGRLGAVAATSGDENHSFGPWFGISATTGAYRKLDLPDLATDSPMRLSPDGFRIAYWVTGPTRKKDYGPPRDDSSGGPLPEKPLAGVAVYDTRDGLVVRHMIPSDYGLWAGSDAGLSWLDDHTLVFGYSVAAGTNTARPAGSYLWTPGVDEPSRIPGAELETATYVPAYGVPLWVRNNQESFVVVDRRARPTGRTITVPTANTVADAVTFSGDRILKIGDNGGNGIARVLVGRRDTRSSVALAAVTDVVFPHFLGWQSSSKVLVDAELGQENFGELTRVLEGKDADTRWLYSIDLDNRHARRLGQVDNDLLDTSLQVATSLLGDPMVHGRKPPSPVDVFRVPLAIGGIALLAGAWFVLRRRRRA